MDDSTRQELEFKGIQTDSDVPLIEEEFSIEIDNSDRSQRSDQVLVARFFAGCVFVVGLISIIPAIYYWWNLPELLPGQSIARWACIAGFLGAVHWLYAIYTVQIVDYSALQAMSVFLLLGTCFYGFAGMSLMLDDGNGTIASFLQLPVALKARAMIWCGIMFGLTALCCYLFGREASLWSRRVVVRPMSQIQ